MSHTETTIYRDTESSPTRGVSIYDIQAVLGLDANDIGQLITATVDGESVINKWARYKPVRHEKLGVLTDAERKLRQHGLTTEMATTTGSPTTSGDFFYKLLNSTLPWTYLAPRGASVTPKEWFRFLDFDGYDTRAVCPVEQFAFDSVMLDYSDDLDLQWAVPEEEDYQLALRDIRLDDEDIKDWYFGAILYHQTSGQYAFAAPSTIGTTGVVSVVFSGMSSWAGRTVKMAPFFSKVQLPRDTTVGGGKYVSLFGYPAVELTISRPSSGIYITFMVNEWNDAGTQISYRFGINNSTASPRSGLSIYIAVVEGNNPSTGTEITHRQINNFSIAGNTVDNTTAMGTFNVTRGSGVYWLTISTPGDTAIPFQAMPIEEPEEEPAEEEE